MTALLAAALLLSSVWPPERVVGEGWGLNLGFNDLAPIEQSKIAQTGMKWVRRDLFWHVVEPKRGLWDWSVYDRLLTDLEAMKMKPVFILCYGNGLYQSDAPRTPEARAAFCRYVQAAVNRYKGRGIIWEVWNEPNNHHWQPKPNVKEYIQLALEASRAFKTAAPSEVLVGPALAGFDWPFAEACFKAGLLKHWDGVTVHPYRPMEPESSAQDYARLASLIKRFAPIGKQIPILCGEIGFSDISVAGKDEQASYFVRQYLVNLASGVPLTIWYNWSDNGEDPKNPEHHYGIAGIAPEFKSKPAYQAAKALTTQLAGYRYSKRLALGRPDDWILLFTKGSQSAVAAWTASPKLSSVPNELQGFVSAASLSGSVLSSKPTVLTSSPIYLTFPRGWNPNYASAPELPLFMSVDSAKDLTAQLSAFHGRKVTLTSSGYSRALTLGSSSDKALDDLPRFRDRSRIPSPLSVSASGVPQRTSLLHSSPLDLTLSSQGTSAAVTLEPHGRGFSGEAQVESSERAARIPVKVGPGESAMVKVTNPSKPFSVRLIEKGKEVRREGPWQVYPLSLFGAKVALEGDAKVAGRVESNLSKAGEGPAQGAPSLKLDFDFDKGWRYALLSPPQPISLLPGSQSLTYWVRGDGSGVLLLIRYLDSTGQTFQPEGVPVNWKGWRPITFALDGSSGGRWGGANDGKVHLPIKLTALAVLDNPQGRGIKGQVEIASPNFVRLVPSPPKRNLP